MEHKSTIQSSSMNFLKFTRSPMPMSIPPTTIVTYASKYLNYGCVCFWSLNRASALILKAMARSSEIKQHAMNAERTKRCGDGRSMRDSWRTVRNPTCKLSWMQIAFQTDTKSPCNHHACPCCQYANYRLLNTSLAQALLPPTTSKFAKTNSPSHRPIEHWPFDFTPTCPPPKQCACWVRNRKCLRCDRFWEIMNREN